MADSPRRNSSTTALYPGILGPGWLELAEPLRQAHSLGVEQRARGSFHIRRGGSLIARAIAGVLRLPGPASESRAELQIVPEPEGERWERTFGGSVLNTRQRKVREGLLGERIGVFELRFEVAPNEGGLIYRQVSAGICVGRFYVRLPPRYAPVIAAEEMPDGDSVRVEVSVTHPCAGLLLSYDGCIRVAEGRG